jgi:hypothetical protein
MLEYANGSVAIVINKADAIILVTGYDVTYDGSPHTATGSATGVKGEALAGLDLSGTTHTDPGDYIADPWAFTDATGNYNNTSGTVDSYISAAPVYPQEGYRFILPYLEQFAVYQVTPFDVITSSDLHGPVYFYHPITAIDMSPFDNAFTLEIDAYNFIDGTINIQGHDSLLPILEELKKKKKNEI